MTSTRRAKGEQRNVSKLKPPLPNQENDAPRRGGADFFRVSGKKKGVLKCAVPGGSGTAKTPYSCSSAGKRQGREKKVLPRQKSFPPRSAGGLTSIREVGGETCQAAKGKKGAAQCAVQLAAPLSSRSAMDVKWPQRGGELRENPSVKGKSEVSLWDAKRGGSREGRKARVRKRTPQSSAI